VVDLVRLLTIRNKLKPANSQNAQSALVKEHGVNAQRNVEEVRK